MRTVGTVSRGVRCPVVKEGDDLIRIVTEAIADMGKEEHITFHEKDIVAVTEAVVARTQGNYAVQMTLRRTAAQNLAAIPSLSPSRS